MPTEEELQQESEFNSSHIDNEITPNLPIIEVVDYYSNNEAESAYQSESILNKYNSPDIASSTGGLPWGAGSYAYDRWKINKPVNEGLNQSYRQQNKIPVGRPQPTYESLILSNLFGAKNVIGLSPDKFSSLSWVNNTSKKTIYCKPDANGDAIAVNPNSTYNTPIDGVATHLYCAKVYKVVDGTKIKVEEDGNITVYYVTGVGGSSVEKYIGQQIKGGWKDVDWWIQTRENEFKNYNVPVENNQWNNLFIKSAHICEN